MQMKLSETLRNIRDQFRGCEIADGQVVIRGEALSNLVETLDLAARAAVALEYELDHGAPAVHARPAGRVVLLPRRRPPHHAPDPRHAGAKRPSVWSAGRNTPDDGGSAA